METSFRKRRVTPMPDASEDAGTEKLEAVGTGPSIPDEDGFKLMMGHKRSVAKVSLFVGIPLVYVMAIKNFIKGDNIMAFLNCMMLLILILLGFVTRRRIEEKSEYKIYSILFRLFFAVMGVSLFYDIGFQSNFSRIEWCYIYPVLVFLAVGVREGAIWVSIFYGILAFFILDFDLQGITLFQIQELRTRFLFSFFAVCTLSFLLEHGFRRIQQRLLHHQSILKKSENRYRQAYEQLNIEMQERRQAEEALRASEERYRTILEDIEEGYFEVDLAGNFTFLNDSVCSTIGYSREELIGMNNRQYVDEKNAKKIFEAFNQIYRTGEPGRVFDYEIIRKDGTKRQVEVSASLRKDSSAKPIGFRGVTRDITERKQAEEALRQSEERHRTILENMQEVYYEIDLAGNWIFLNDAFSNHLGYTKEEMVGKKSRQYQDETTAEKLYQAYTRLYRTGEPIKAIEGTWISKDGAKNITEMSASLIRDSEGKPIGFRGVSRDITERKRAEEDLRRSQAQLSNALKMAKLGHWELDIDSGMFTFSDNFYEIFRTTAEKAGGYQMSIADYAKHFVHPEDSLLVAEETRKAIETDDPNFSRYLEHRMFYSDGSVGHIAVRFFIVKDNKGKTIKTYGVNQDVTERKRAEEERLALQQQLRQSQKMEAIGHLAGGVAHDFNNLLTVIHGYSELLLNSLDQNSRLRQDVLEIKNASERASSLTNQLLAFSRKQLLQPKVLDLNIHVSSMDKMLRRTIGENIELVSLLAKDLGRIEVDPGQIEQVILNLAINAKDAMSNGGKLTIETANVILDEGYACPRVGVTPGCYVMLSVSDTGSGMTPEIKERIFEPFFTTKEKGKGTGLGLSTVYGIVQQSGGDVWVYSEPGVGSTFKIYLPAIEEGTESLRPASIPTESTQGSETILLVEDEEMVRKLACTVLHKKGYTVLEASNGEGALRIVQGQNGNPIHLMVTDVVMPGMSGRQLADRLSSLRPEMKVLYMSGYTDDAIVHHGVLDAGIAYIQKPFAPDALVEKVREVLDGT